MLFAIVHSEWMDTLNESAWNRLENEKLIRMYMCVILNQSTRGFAFAFPRSPARVSCFPRTLRRRTSVRLSCDVFFSPPLALFAPFRDDDRRVKVAAHFARPLGEFTYVALYTQLNYKVFAYTNP